MLRNETCCTCVFAGHSRLSHAVCDTLRGTRREVLSFRSMRLHAPATPQAPTACVPVAAHDTGRAYAAPGAASHSSLHLRVSRITQALVCPCVCRESLHLRAVPDWPTD